ncbi:MAG: GNAT family N-acetyltransferase [Acutalibacteraceae bacterium]|nr:GNAT family N-acetyltransferase [Acutalibacteraceae bacterium]
MNIRSYHSDDCQAILSLFYETVHKINQRDYTRKQIEAWTNNNNIDPTAWNLSLTHHKTLVVEMNGIIVGFGDLNGNFLDRLYVHAEYQRRGIATAIMDRLERYAAEQNYTTIVTHASITAYPFFRDRNYQLLKEQQVERHGVFLKNIMMQKELLIK